METSTTRCTDSRAHSRPCLGVVLSCNHVRQCEYDEVFIVQCAPIARTYTPAKRWSSARETLRLLHGVGGQGRDPCYDDYMYDDSDVVGLHAMQNVRWVASGRGYLFGRSSIAARSCLSAPHNVAGRRLGVIRTETLGTDPSTGRRRTPPVSALQLEAAWANPQICAQVRTASTSASRSRTARRREECLVQGWHCRPASLWCICVLGVIESSSPLSPSVNGRTVRGSW